MPDELDNALAVLKKTHGRVVIGSFLVADNLIYGKGLAHIHYGYIEGAARVFCLAESSELFLSDKCKAELNKVDIFALVDRKIYKVFFYLSLFFFGYLEDYLGALEYGSCEIKFSYLENAGVVYYPEIEVV